MEHWENLVRVGVAGIPVDVRPGRYLSQLLAYGNHRCAIRFEYQVLGESMSDVYGIQGRDATRILGLGLSPVGVIEEKGQYSTENESECDPRISIECNEWNMEPRT